MDITHKTPALPFTGILVSPPNGSHVPPMQIVGGVLPLKVMRHVTDMPHNL